MPRNDLTHITVLLDRSGSMDSIREDVIGGFNNFISEQARVPGPCLVSLVQFDNVDPQEQVYLDKPINEVPYLTRVAYVPRGTTPLHDAAATCIDYLGTRLERMPDAERPGKVIFVIFTDGMNNSSMKYTKEQVRERVRRQEGVYKWQFVFMGVGFDAYVGGGEIGMAAASIISGTRGQTFSTYNVASAAVADYRTGKDSKVDVLSKLHELHDKPQA